MIRRPPRSTRTDTLFPYTTLFRSGLGIDFKIDCAAVAKFAVDDRAGAIPAALLFEERVIDDDPEFEIGEADRAPVLVPRSEEHTSELQSLMRISYAVFCLKKKKNQHTSILQRLTKQQ